MAAGIVAYGWLTLFQLLLAAGVPLGRMAWGGAHRVLPPRMRWASLASAGLTGLGLLVMLQVGGFIGPVLPAGAVGPVLWGLCGLFAISTLANLFGASGAERIHGVPLAAICAISAGWLAMAGG